MSHAELLENKDHNNVWNYIQQELKEQYGESTFKNWFTKLQLLSSSINEVTLSVPTNFMREWITTYYLEMIKKYWKKYDKFIINVRIIVVPISHCKQSQQIEKVNQQQDFFNQISPPSNDELTSALDNRFTFENFVIDSSNELAYEAALSIAKAHEVNLKSNPLFLYSGVGLGKTHLMQSIAWYMYKNNFNKKIIYMSAEKFMYQFVKALRNKDVMSFKDQFRKIDILMIDDVQFICGKESTQEEFFHTFNSLVDNGKQMIISCDRIPNNLENIKETIKSRLNGGLVIDIANTTYSLRLKILQSKVSKMNFFLPNDVLEFLAENITSNIRELEGALNKVIAYSHLRKSEINISNTKQILHDIVGHNQNITIANIQKQVSKFYNISVDDLVSQNRLRVFARPRQIAIYLSKILTSKSLTEISKTFQRKDHTTIMHAVKNVESLKNSDKYLNQELESIICNLKK